MNSRDIVIDKDYEPPVIEQTIVKGTRRWYQPQNPRGTILEFFDTKEDAEEHNQLKEYVGHSRKVYYSRRRQRWVSWIGRKFA